MQIKAIILGADKLTNTEATPTLLQTIHNTPIIHQLTHTIQSAGISDISVVVNTHHKEILNTLKSCDIFYQPIQLGTGNALLMAQEKLTPFDGCVMIFFADTPLIQVDTIKNMLNSYKQGGDVVVLGFIPTDARRYGRLIIGNHGLEKIVEYKEATDTERTIRLCNSGVMCVNGKYILELVQKIKNNNSAGEYYMTDIVHTAFQMGLKTKVVMGSPQELHGINSQEELEAAEALFIQLQKRKKNDY